MQDRQRNAGRPPARARAAEASGPAPYARTGCRTGPELDEEGAGHAQVVVQLGEVGRQLERVVDVVTEVDPPAADRHWIHKASEAPAVGLCSLYQLAVGALSIRPHCGNFSRTKMTAPRAPEQPNCVPARLPRVPRRAARGDWSGHGLYRLPPQLCLGRRGGRFHAAAATRR